VTVFCADPGRECVRERDEVYHGVKIVRRGGSFGIYAHAALYLIRHAQTFDRILDVQNGVPFFTPLFSRTPTTLMVHHIHDRNWFAEFPYPVAAVGRFVERRVMPRLYRRNPVVTVSPTSHEDLVRLGVDPSRIRIVYSGIAKPDPPPPPTRPFGHRVAYVGRIKRYKRLDLLVRAVAGLRHEFPDLQLDVAGDGDARPEIESLVKALGLQECTRIHGFVDEETKAQILQTATVFGMPSKVEGWGLSVIEANLFGCPAVAYDVPGLRAAIRHGETGLLAEDDAQFRDGLAMFLRNPEERGRYSAKARRWSQQFDWGRAATETLEVMVFGGASRAMQADAVEPAAW
jgi:glycosyltransferase involved in cell wall biosynthesis